jgi:hypothetical protein
MTLPITNLTANWSSGTGIQLSWEAAGDATTGSSYQVYYLNQSNQFVLTGNLLAISIKQTGSTAYVLTPPSTQFLFSWQTILTINGTGLAPSALTLQVVHTDSLGAGSTPVSVLSVQTNAYAYSGIPHFDNNFTFNTVSKSFAVTSQGSNSEIANCVAVVLGTRPNQRSLVPYFGIEDLPINKINTPDVTQIINSWEPRAQIEVSTYYDEFNQAQINVKVSGIYGD